MENYIYYIMAAFGVAFIALTGLAIESRCYLKNVQKLHDGLQEKKDEA